MVPSSLRASLTTSHPPILALIAADYGHDVIFHAGQQRSRVIGAPLSSGIPSSASGYANQIVANDEHLVLYHRSSHRNRPGRNCSHPGGRMGCHFITFSGLMVLNCAPLMRAARASFSSVWR